LTKVILIRHGQTDWNCQKRYCSFTDVDLNQKGRAQVRQLSKQLSNEKVDKVYSSDMKRALQSARIIFKDTPLEEVAALREINFGMFEGLRYQEIMERYGGIYRKWLDNPFGVAIPRGESLSSFVKRVRKALRRILSRNNNNRTVVIVAHGGPIRVVLCDVLGLDVRKIWQIEPKLASISVIEFAKGKNKSHLLNEAAYLNG